MDETQYSQLAGLLGIDPEKLRQQQQTQGLLSAGLNILAASGPSAQPRSLGQIIGQGGMAGMQAYQEAGQRAIDVGVQGLKIAEIKKKFEDERRIRELGGRLMEPQKAMVSSTDVEAQEGGYRGEPGVNVLPTRMVMNQNVARQLMATPGGMEYLKNYVVTQRELAGKTEVVEIYGPSGQPIKVRYNLDTNEYTPLGGEKAEPLKELDLGDRIELRTTSGKLVGRINKGVAPTAPSYSLNEKTGLLVESRTGVVSQPRDSQGNIVDVSQFKEPTAEAQKQITGVQNTRNAISEFRSELQNFSRLDTLKPKELARIQSKYNNMMLQAKEAYNLGVLNGPDKQILEEIIYNPATMRGVVVGREGIDAQASELDRIMANIKTTVQTRGAPLPTPAQPPAPTPKKNEIPVPSQAFIDEVNQEMKRRGIR
jgi:hypothetical protein